MNLIPSNSQYLSIKRGDTLRLNFIFNTDDNILLNLTDCTARLHLKSLRSNVLIIDATTENGLLTIEPEEGLVKLLVPAQDMMHAPIGRHKYDLELSFSDGTILSSTTNILEIITDITADQEQALIPYGISGYSGN